MHMKQDSNLIPADTELERTLRSLRKTKRAENATMAYERQDQTEEQRTAAKRYESLPYGSVDTWEELVEAYLGRFFPPSLTS